MNTQHQNHSERLKTDLYVFDEPPGGVDDAYVDTSLATRRLRLFSIWAAGGDVSLLLTLLAAEGLVLKLEGYSVSLWVFLSSPLAYKNNRPAYVLLSVHLSCADVGPRWLRRPFGGIVFTNIKLLVTC